MASVMYCIKDKRSWSGSFDQELNDKTCFSLHDLWSREEGCKFLFCNKDGEICLYRCRTVVLASVLPQGFKCVLWWLIKHCGKNLFSSLSMCVERFFFHFQVCMSSLVVKSLIWFMCVYLGPLAIKRPLRRRARWNIGLYNQSSEKCSFNFNTLIMCYTGAISTNSNQVTFIFFIYLTDCLLIFAFILSLRQDSAQNEAKPSCVWVCTHCIYTLCTWRSYRVKGSRPPSLTRDKLSGKLLNTPSCYTVCMLFQWFCDAGH